MSSLLREHMQTFSNMATGAPAAQPEAAPTPAAPANTNAAPSFMADPKAPTSKVVMETILQRFLQDFEYVELDYPVSGSVVDPTEQLTYHPHIQFRMCGEDRQKLDHDQTNTFLSRQIDRATYILKKMGFEVDDFYVTPETGTLKLDAMVPKDKLPEGTTQKQVLEAFVERMQQACTEARGKRSGPQLAAG